jgi:hypothetical protein
VSDLSLDELAERCTEETEKYLHDQPFEERYCFELFRRALVNRDQMAWDKLYAQYEPLVMKWVLRHSSFSKSGEEATPIVNGAFGRFWQAVSPQKFADKFESLGKLLRYLKMCVHSEITDCLRRNTTPPLISLNAYTESVEDQRRPAPHRAWRLERLEQVVMAQAKNRKEKLIIEFTFFYGLKPRQIYQLHGGLFKSVREVYSVKRNVLNRLLRNKELRALREEMEMC